MRHLPSSEIESVVRRGKSVEQFLGKGHDGRTLRWVELRPSKEVVEVWVFEVEDVGSIDYLDLYSFPEVGASFEEPLARLPFTEAIEWCERNLSASPMRWVNQGVVQDEYAETFA